MRSHRQQYHDAGSHKANSLQTGNGCIEPSKLHTRAHKHHFNTASHSLWTSLLKLPQHGWIVAAPPHASVMLMMYTSTLSLHGGRMLMQRSTPPCLHMRSPSLIFLLGLERVDCFGSLHCPHQSSCHRQSDKSTFQSKVLSSLAQCWCLRSMHAQHPCRDIAVPS